MKSAKTQGFIPKFSPMTEKQTHNFIGVIMAPDDKTIEFLEGDVPFPIQIIQKRIEVMNLPISFTPKALLIALIMTDGNPGKMITVLIDCLDNFLDDEENPVEIDDDKLSMNLYPWGFYNNDSFQQYVETYLKPRKVKWGHIY